MEAATSSILISHLHTCLPSSSLSLSSKLPHLPKQGRSYTCARSLTHPQIPKSATVPKHTSPSSVTLRVSHSTLTIPFKSLSSRPNFQLYCSSEGVALEEIPLETQDKVQKRKLIVVNLPWSYSNDDLKNAFKECGTVRLAEIIKNKDGRNRGFAFVTMASGEEAQAVIDKFNSKELGGRTIKVEFARRLKKPRPQPANEPPPQDTRHKLYVSNLQWKTRSSHLREFFSASFNPVSARVVFENASGKSGGYGFVSFTTREEAEAALSSLNGKELLGRPVQLKFSEKTSEAKTENQEEEVENQDEYSRPLGGEEFSEAEQNS